MKQPITIRASSFGQLFDCPARWLAIHIEGRSAPQTSRAALGTAIHSGTASFDSERVSGQEPSISAAQDAAIESIRNPRGETDWDSPQEEAEKIAVSLTKKYCAEESHKHNFVAVEASVEALHITDLGIVLTGTTDRVELTDEGYGIRDIKSGKTAVGTDGRAKTHGHGAQMGVYELVAQAATGLPITAPAQIIGLQTNKTEAAQRIGTGEIYDAREALLGDKDHVGLLATAARLVHGEIPPWGNPKSMMCSNRYCPAFQNCFWRK